MTTRSSMGEYGDTGEVLFDSSLVTPQRANQAAIALVLKSGSLSILRGMGSPPIPQPLPALWTGRGVLSFGLFWPPEAAKTALQKQVPPLHWGGARGGGPSKRELNVSPVLKLSHLAKTNNATYNSRQNVHLGC
jgi:hypothetical protein